MPFVLYSFYYRDKDTNYSKKFILITSMICLFLSMTFASSVEKGIQFDVRYVILFFALVFGGFRIGLLLVLEFVLYRLYLGGPGTSSAMGILLVTFPCRSCCAVSTTGQARSTWSPLWPDFAILFSPASFVYQPARLYSDSFDLPYSDHTRSQFGRSSAADLLV